MKLNTSRVKSFRIVGLGLAFAIFAASGWAQENSTSQEKRTDPVRYTVIDLGPLGPPPGQPFVITNNGLVSGDVVLADGTSHAVIYHKGSMKDISTPGLRGPNSAAFGVNEWGQVVGQADTSSLDPKGENFCGSVALQLHSDVTTCLPFLWEHGVMTALPTLHDKEGGQGNNGLAFQINNRGQVVGSAENTTLDSTCPGPSMSPQLFQFKPVIWSKPFPWGEPRIQELSTVADDPDGVAFAINDLGQAVGASGGCGAFNTISLDNLVPRHALLWENGTVTDLPNLGGDGLFGGIYADGLNNHGQVVGSSDGPQDAYFHALLWQNGVMTDLGTLLGDVNSVAVSVNDRGDLVGLSLDAKFNPTAVLWHNGKITNLNKLIPADSPLFLQTACSINSRGEIIGIAVQTSTNEPHGYLAIPSLSEADTESATPAVDGASNETVKIPENVRELIRQRSPFTRFATRPTQPQ